MRDQGANTPKRSLATAEARSQLPKLVKGMSEKRRPSGGLLDDAVEIGPHRKGGAMLVPEVDVRAHARDLQELQAKVDELEDEIEDLGLALFLQERLAKTSGRRLTAEEFLRGIGMEDHVERLPGA